MMGTSGIPAQVYLAGSAEKLSVTLYVRSPKSIVISSPTLGTRNLIVPKSTRSLETFGADQVLLDLDGTKVIISRGFARDVEKALWPAWQWNRSPVFMSFLAGMGALVGVLILGIIVELTMPMFLKRMASETFRREMEVRPDACRAELNEMANNFDTKPSQVYLSELDMANAFALPDETIVFTEEMLRMMDENSFFGVYAHELGHIHLGHTSKLLGRFDLLRRFVSSYFGWLGEILGAVALNQFSQTQEAEADAFSRDFMVKHHIDPTSTAKLFEDLGKDSSGLKYLQFLSTHPSYESRVSFFRQINVKEPKKYLSASQWAAIRNGCKGKIN